MSIDYKIRVNIGLVCPCCGSKKTKPGRLQYSYACENCPEEWDGHYFPLPSLQPEKKDVAA